MSKKKIKDVKNGLFKLEKDKQDRNIITLILVLISIPLVAIDIDYLFNDSKYFNINEDIVMGVGFKFIFFVIPIVSLYRVVRYFLDRK